MNGATSAFVSVKVRDAGRWLQRGPSRPGKGTGRRIPVSHRPNTAPKTPTRRQAAQP